MTGPAGTPEDDDWHGLHPKARVVWGVAGAVPAALIGLAGAIAVSLAASPAWALPVLIAAGTLAATWWRLAGRRWQAWGYSERDLHLLIRRGVLVRRLTIVPYGRMQFVDVEQGPLARALGVSTVQLHTAAAATDARIPFVSDDEAIRLRDRLTALGEAHAAGL